MRRIRHSILLASRLSIVAALLAPAAAQADTFGSGPDSFQIDFVQIGQPNNPADMGGQPSPAGSVRYEYRIGKYEISEQMIAKANALSAAAGAPLGITIDARGPDKPATSVSWFEAARFVNWLNESEGHQTAYKFAANGSFQLWQSGDPGFDPDNLFRNSLAHYFLPSADEWYKAAFYDPVAGVYYNYPTGSDSPPLAVPSGTSPGTAVFQQGLAAGPADITQAGGLSPFGTMAQGGNAGESDESESDLMNDDPNGLRGGRGGNWDTLTAALSSSLRSAGSPSIGSDGRGFRVAGIVPEPVSLALSGLAVLAVLCMRRTRRAI